MEGDSKLDFRENRLIPLGTLVYPSTRLARNSFKQRDHVFSCCFIMVMNLLVINLQCNSFIAWVIIRVVCLAQKKGVPTTRTSRPFGADRDFVDTGQEVPNPTHPVTDLWHPWVGTAEKRVVPRCVSTISIGNTQEVNCVGHLVWFLVNSQRNSNILSIP